MGYGNVAPAPVMSAASAGALMRPAATPAAPMSRLSIASPEVMWTAALGRLFPDCCRFVTARTHRSGRGHETVMQRRYPLRSVLPSQICHNVANRNGRDRTSLEAV